jgi:hypothetical protein
MAGVSIFASDVARLNGCGSNDQYQACQGAFALFRFGTSHGRH